MVETPYGIIYNYLMNNLLQKILTLPALTLSPAEWTKIFDQIYELNSARNSILEEALNQTTIPPWHIGEIVKYLEPWHKAAPLPPSDLTVPLSVSELAAIDNIMSAYVKMHFRNLQNILQSDFKPAVLNQIMQFLDVLYDIADTILQWNRQLIELWGKINRQIPMGADDLVPLLNELLPADIEQLKQVLEKLKTAGEIEQRGEAACYISNLYLAVAAKVRDMSEPSPKKYPVSKPVMRMVSEIRARETVQFLITVCQDFKLELIDYFLDQLKSDNKSAYEQHVDEKLGKEQIMEKIIIANLKNTIINTEDLSLIETKYNVMIDLQSGLAKGDDDTYCKLLAFAKKFVNYKSILLRTMDSSALQFFKSSSSSLRLDRLYFLLRPQSKEQRFLETAAMVSQKILQEELNQSIEDDVKSLIAAPGAGR